MKGELKRGGLTTQRFKHEFLYLSLRKPPLFKTLLYPFSQEEESVDEGYDASYEQTQKALLRQKEVAAGNY